MSGFQAMALVMLVWLICYLGYSVSSELSNIRTDVDAMLVHAKEASRILSDIEATLSEEPR